MRRWSNSRAIKARAGQRNSKAARQAIEDVANQREAAERRERRRGEQWRVAAVAVLTLYVVAQVAALSAGWIALSWDPAIVAQHGSMGLAVGVLFGFCKLESRRHFRVARDAEEFRTRLGVAGDRIARAAAPDDKQLSTEEMIRLVFGLGLVQADAGNCRGRTTCRPDLRGPGMASRDTARQQHHTGLPGEANTAYGAAVAHGDCVG